MKQGTANNTSAPKMEPVAKAINVDAVSVIGQAVSYVKPDLSDGRGYMAPKNASHTSHKGGTQGRH